VDKELLTRDEILKELRQNIQQAQVRMKQNADKHRRDVEFAVGDWVYLRLQPYRQSSVNSLSQLSGYQIWSVNLVANGSFG
jgi:hypothetical protein